MIAEHKPQKPVQCGFAALRGELIDAVELSPNVESRIRMSGDMQRDFVEWDGRVVKGHERRESLCMFGVSVVHRITLADKTLLACTTMYAYLDHQGPIPFAHRGGAGHCPENTWPAFEHARSLGFRYFETDAHATSDGTVLAFHDEVLDRVTDQRGVIAQLPWQEVRVARVAGTEPIVLLEELLGSFPDTFVNIDAKHDAVVEPLVRVLHRTSALERVCIASFSDRRLVALRARLGPRVCMAGGPAAVRRLRAGSLGLPVPRSNIACVQVPLRSGPVPIVDARFVEFAHRRGTAVHVWTIDDPIVMERLIALGVDGIMSDDLVALRNVFRKRGLWYSE
jgi:glycerophosphoryl diester phosphodiesterase